MKDLVTGATEKNAIENIKKFVADCEKVSGLNGIKWSRMPENDLDGSFCHDGRFCFHLKYKERVHYVYMPGLPLEKVRYINSETQNIWDFPLLYVNGGDGVWCYALLRREDWILEIRENKEHAHRVGQMNDILVKLDKVAVKLNSLYEGIEYRETFLLDKLNKILRILGEKRNDNNRQQQ